MFRNFFDGFLVDLGELEGDYRFAQLKSDIKQSLLQMFIIAISILALLGVDAVLFKDYPELFRSMVIWRVGYVLVTILFGAAVYRAEKVRIYDRLMLGWMFFTVLFFLLFNFTRPANYVTTAFDIIVLFAIYLLSPLRIKYTVALAIGFSLGTIYIDHVIKTGMDWAALSVSAYALFIANLLGLISVLQIQSYRRKSFKAYIEEKDAREMVAYLANIDPLTKSLTRRQFMNISESEFRRFLRYHRALSILILDADRFKVINDTYGHHAGDLVLRSLSLVAMEQKRAQDTFGRLGGEEFGLLMPETHIEQALVVAERIRHVWEKSPVNLDGELITSTISIGLAEALETDHSIEDIMRRADRLLYKAKESGRNQVATK